MKAKVTLTFILFLVLFSLVSLKAFYIQVVNRNKLIAYSNSQIVRISKSYPKRGMIFDRNKNPLAINVRKYNVFAVPKSMKEITSELRQLSKIMGGTSFADELKSIKARKKYTWLLRKVELTDEQVEKIKNLNSIFVEEQSSRYYPNHELLAQTLGFVGVDNDGLAGIEYYFNKELKGQEVIKKYYKDAKGRPIKFESADIEVGAKDIYLSIDKEIQAVLEKSLKDAVEKHSAESGGAAVMDVETGEIWAIANYPTYDPNHYSKYDISKRKLAFVTDPFEPGSILKTFTIMAALENNIAKSDTNYFCENGKFLVGNHYISESDSNHAYEWLSVEDILKYSSNIGTTKIAFDLTYPLLKKFLIKMNLNDKTGIEIPGESRGIFEDRDKINPLRLSNISFGQGIATTGIQVLSSFATIANGGYEIRPTLIKQSKGNKGKRIVEPDVVKQINKMLIQAVNNGTGDKAKVPHFVIAGKTSTAQKANANGKYEGYVSGFIGYPVNVKKRFVVFAYVSEPKENGYYGNQVAAPIFRKIVQNILYQKKEYSQLALIDGGRKNIDVISYRQSSSRRLEVGRVPNLKGLDKTSAKNLLEKANLNYEFIGFGIAKKQYPKAGTPVDSNTRVKLYFKTPKYD